MCVCAIHLLQGIGSAMWLHMTITVHARPGALTRSDCRVPKDADAPVRISQVLQLASDAKANFAKVNAHHHG